MANKEALERIIKSHSIAMACLGIEDKETEQAIDIIEKDLEVLEILKKHSTRLDDADWNSNIFNGIDYEYLDEEERKVIKEWLENE